MLNRQHFERVVREGILKARTSLAIATADFKSMLVPTRTGRQAASILQVFKRLARRGVEVRVLHSGVPTGPILKELMTGSTAGVTIRRCPRVHIKAVVVDCSNMYIGSANLTGAGLGAKSETRRNFEAGVWTHSVALIEGFLEQFDAIWEGRLCASCGRRAVCPVPLEEPGH